MGYKYLQAADRHEVWLWAARQQGGSSGGGGIAGGSQRCFGPSDGRSLNWRGDLNGRIQYNSSRSMPGGRSGNQKGV